MNSRIILYLNILNERKSNLQWFINKLKQFFRYFQIIFEIKRVVNIFTKEVTFHSLYTVLTIS